MTPRETRDQRLHDLYRNRELLVFTQGQAWWDNTIKNLWLRHVEDAHDAIGIDINAAIAQIEWEHQHGYLQEAQP